MHRKGRTYPGGFLERLGTVQDDVRPEDRPGHVEDAVIGELRGDNGRFVRGAGGPLRVARNAYRT